MDIGGRAKWFDSHQARITDEIPFSPRAKWNQFIGRQLIIGCKWFTHHIPFNKTFPIRQVKCLVCSPRPNRCAIKLMAGLTIFIGNLFKNDWLRSFSWWFVAPTRLAHLLLHRGSIPLEHETNQPFCHLISHVISVDVGQTLRHCVFH